LESKIRATRAEFEMIKSFFQIQILLESLDDVYYSTNRQIKAATKNYLNILNVHADSILKSMYLSNQELYQLATNKIRNCVDEIENYFEIIE
jgi:hypothetical protein